MLDHFVGLALKGLNFNINHGNIGNAPKGTFEIHLPVTIFKHFEVFLEFGNNVSRKSIC